MPQDRTGPSSGFLNSRLGTTKQTPSLRAATKTERFADMLRNLYESVAEQPLARISDTLGVTNLGGVANEFSNPQMGMRTAEIPVKPPAKGIISNALNNASGESMASMEALNRMRSMKDKGQQYIVRRGGTQRPLIGPEAVDYVPRPGEEYGILENGLFRLLQRGGR